MKNVVENLSWKKINNRKDDYRNYLIGKNNGEIIVVSYHVFFVIRIIRFRTSANRRGGLHESGNIPDERRFEILY